MLSPQMTFLISLELSACLTARSPTNCILIVCKDFLTRLGEQTFPTQP
jgi:hypothetical protein